MEGSGLSLYSSNEWTTTTVEGEQLYRGKWGHTVESFFTKEDLNNDGKISSGNVEIEFWNDRDSVSKRRINGNESKVPALFIIAGKPEDAPFVNDVFVTRPGCKSCSET